MLIAEPGRTPWDLRWTMFGIPVRVHPLFWLISLMFGYQKNLDFSLVLISIACVFVSILLHEFGHALAFRYYGVRRVHVVLYQLGGLAVPGSEPPSQWPWIWTLFWGPGAGFILGVPAMAAKIALEHGLFEVPVPVYYAIQQLAWINIIWGLVNLLLPILPLDGGQIMREVVQWKAPQRGDFLALTISFYAGIVASLLAIAWFIYQKDPDFRGLFPAFLFGNLAYSSYAARKQISEFGGFGDSQAPRQAWEQDPDWWKK